MKAVFILLIAILSVIVLYQVYKYPALLPVIIFLYQIWQYLDQRKRELRDKRFETYHRLIRDLVEPSDGKSLYLDRQIAVAFELRNFPEYKEVTQRIISGLRENWAKNTENPSLNRLLTEIDFTLRHLEEISS